MTYGALTPGDFAPFDRVVPSRIGLIQPVLCAVALTLGATVGLWVLYGRSDTAPTSNSPTTQAPAQAAKSVPVSLPPAIMPLRHYAALLDPHFTAGRTPMTFAQSAPLRASFEPLRQAATTPTAPLVAQALAPPAKPSVLVASLPLPTPRPTLPLTGRPAVPAPGPAIETDVDDQAADVAPQPAQTVASLPLPTPRPVFPLPTRTSPAPRRFAQQPVAPAPQAPGVPAAPTEASPSFFDKFFGALKPNQALAYAAPEDNGLLGSPGAPDRYTAVYNITTHTVTLPDGTRLEAHSGLGPHVDNPASVALRMRGATPPNLYELTLRESPFHGVRALRMTPTGGTTYGRGGLLTHSYMLRGGLAESNGCVVFKNYPAFLAAYDRGQVRRLRVIAGV